MIHFINLLSLLSILYYKAFIIASERYHMKEFVDSEAKKIAIPPITLSAANFKYLKISDDDKHFN